MTFEKDKKYCLVKIKNNFVIIDDVREVASTTSLEAAEAVIRLFNL